MMVMNLMTLMGMKKKKMTMMMMMMMMMLMTLLLLIMIMTMMTTTMMMMDWNISWRPEYTQKDDEKYEGCRGRERGGGAWAEEEDGEEDQLKTNWSLGSLVAFVNPPHLFRIISGPWKP